MNSKAESVQFETAIGRVFAIVAWCAAVLALAFCWTPATAFAATKYVDISQDTTWRSQDWRGDPIQEPEHNDGIVITLRNNATVTVTGQQYFFGDVTIQGQGTIKRASGFDPDTTFFTVGDAHSADTAGYPINVTIAGDVVIDGNARENGMTNKALINMTAADKADWALGPNDGTDLTLTLKDNAKIKDMYVNYESPGAGIWATAGNKSSVTINMQDNAAFEDMNGIAVRGNDNHGRGPITLNMSGNAAITGTSLNAVTGVNYLNMSDNAKITGTTGDFAVHIVGGTVNMSDEATVRDNPGGGMKLDGKSVATIGGNASIVNNTVGSSSTSANGAGLYTLGTTKVSLTGSATVSDNVAQSNGGGVYAAGSSVVQVRENAKVSGNRSTNGGGIALSGNASMTISGNGEISDNVASQSGGGVYMLPTATGTIAHVNGGTISGNTARSGNGGGIDAERANGLDLAGGVITENTAAGLGAGVYAPYPFYIQGAPQVSGNADSATKGNIFMERGAVMQLVQNRTISSPLASIGVLMREAQAGDHIVESPSGTTFGESDAARFFYDTDAWHVGVDHTQANPTNLVLSADAPQVYDIADADVEPIADQAYTGNPITPSLAVKHGGRTLKEGTDYTLEYGSNVEIGEAVVTVAGMGDFLGSKQVTFNIGAKEETEMWTRIAGSTRYATAAAIVEEGFGDGSCDTVVVASGEGFPDALAASALAGACKAPVILTKGASLSPEAKAQIERVGAKNAYLIGGTKVLTRQVKTDLEDLGLSVTRISGSTRQETSTAVARWVDRFSRMQTIVIAYGQNFPDALSMGSYSYATKSPIILTNKAGQLTAEEVTLIKSFGVKDIVIVGGTNAVSRLGESQLGSTYNIVRLAGKNRYDTSAAIARWVLGETAGDADAPAFQPKTTLTCAHPGVATGENFPDALAGACLCGSKGSVMVLTNGKKAVASSGITSVLAQHVGEIENGYIFGGEGAVSADLVNQLPGYSGAVAVPEDGDGSNAVGAFSFANVSAVFGGSR